MIEELHPGKKDFLRQGFKELRWGGRRCNGRCDRCGQLRDGLWRQDWSEARLSQSLFKTAFLQGRSQGVAVAAVTVTCGDVPVLVDAEITFFRRLRGCCCCGL